MKCDAPLCVYSDYLSLRNFYVGKTGCYKVDVGNKKTQFVQAWRSIIILDRNQLGNKYSLTHESYLQWVIGRAAQIGMPYPMLRPLTSTTPAVPPPLPSKTLEDYQRRLHEANLESDAWKEKYQTSEREKDTLMGILEQTTWEFHEKERENAELKDLPKRKDAIIDRMTGNRRRCREFFVGATSDSEE